MGIFRGFGGKDSGAGIITVKRVERIVNNVVFCCISIDIRKK